MDRFVNDVIEWTQSLLWATPPAIMATGTEDRLMIRTPALRAIAACALLAAFPAAALAADAPVLDQYGNPAAAAVAPASGVAAATGEQVAASSATATTDDSNVGSLPFTGAELTSVVIAALLLLGSGVTLRRVGFAGSRRARRERS
jgi:hypothetical protein